MAPIVGLSGGLALGALAAASYVVLPEAVKRVQLARLRDRCRRTRSLVLSYDDGPGPLLTPRVLERLDAYDARASFCVLGQRAAQHPEIVERLVRAGHEVGSHGFAHRNAWKTWPWETVRDIRSGFEALGAHADAACPFRPPHGKMTLASWWALLARDSRVAWWTLDSGDTGSAPRTPDEVAESLCRAGGGTVLLHDFDRGDGDPNGRARFVVDTTERLLARAAREGLAVRTFGELFDTAHEAGLTPVLARSRAGS